jgi:hypothetical protein
LLAGWWPYIKAYNRPQIPWLLACDFFDLCIGLLLISASGCVLIKKPVYGLLGIVFGLLLIIMALLLFGLRDVKLR